MDKITVFQQSVYNATRMVPKGKVTTYKEIAQYLNKPRAMRAVGNALHVNPFAPGVPCHRVVGSKGDLTGFASGLAAKQELLQKEGIIVKNNKVENLQQHLFRF